MHRRRNRIEDGHSRPSQGHLIAIDVSGEQTSSSFELPLRRAITRCSLRLRRAEVPIFRSPAASARQTLLRRGLGNPESHHRYSRLRNRYNSDCVHNRGDSCNEAVFSQVQCKPMGSFSRCMISGLRRSDGFCACGKWTLTAISKLTG